MTDTNVLLSAIDAADEDVQDFFGDAVASYLFIPYELARELPVTWTRLMTIRYNQLRRAFAHLSLPERYLGRPGERMTYAELSPEDLARLDIAHDDGKYRDWDGQLHGPADELILTDPDASAALGFGMHRTLMQSMPTDWQREVIALARYAFAQPGATRHRTYAIVTEIRKNGRWLEVDDPVPGHDFGLTRLSPHLEPS